MTLKLKHSSPLGALEIPTVPEPVDPGDPFDVDDEIGIRLLEQGDLYQHAAPIDQLRATAVSLNIDTAGMKKADLEAAIATALAETQEDQK